MKNIIFLTTDLPFFPGRNGHDFFILRYLAGANRVGLVAPRYEWMPAKGVENLENVLNRAYLWPAQAADLPLFISKSAYGWLPAWAARIPASWRAGLLYRLLGLREAPSDAYLKLAILANCSPHLLEALHSNEVQAFVLIQSSLEPWLGFLPGIGAKTVYYHDVRCEYLRKSRDNKHASVPVRSEVDRIEKQEAKVYANADAVAFVSSLDQKRARSLWGDAALSEVAPIPIDTEYFVPRADDWPIPKDPIVLFTGHLGHPPNVDAVGYFLEQIWPQVLSELPNARFHVVGMLPAKSLEEQIAKAKNVELHANVPDIRPYFWNASAYVVPMRFGGGVRQKILEAWSMRVPVICTTMAAEGIDVANGRECLLADSPEAFSQSIIGLLRAPEVQGFRETAKAYVDQQHAIDKTAVKMDQLVAQSVAHRKARPFKLLYDLRWMEIGKAGGAEQMTHELISAISSVDSTNEYTIYAPRGTYYEWDFPRRFKVRPRFSDPSALAQEALCANLANQLAESLNQPLVLNPQMRTLRALHEMDFGVVHSMIGYIHPDLEAFPHVLTVHDLQHLKYPEFFSKADWTERERLYSHSARKAKHIICISEYTRQDLHVRYGIPLERMTTIWNIPSRGVWTKLPLSDCRSLLSAMGVKGRYLLFPAHDWPHKNHAALLRAFEMCLDEIPEDYNLVLTGRPFSKGHPASDLMQSPRLRGRVRHLGYRSPLEIKALYQECGALIFPSLFEGFGMPVAEAIIAGKPVLCSNGTSLPEIAGDAALLFDAERAEMIAESIVRFTRSNSLAEELAAAANRRRCLFSSRLNAIKTISIYRKVHDEYYS